MGFVESCESIIIGCRMCMIRYGIVTGCVSRCVCVNRIDCGDIIQGETTFDGLSVLQNQPGAVIDYYSLMYV